MSYGLRNTLILLVTFALTAGGGFSYIWFVQLQEVRELESIREERTGEYEQMSRIARTWTAVETNATRAGDFIHSWNKTLLPFNDPDQIYRFLTRLGGAGPSFHFNYVFTDSTIHDQYGIVRSAINGTGAYRAIYDFVNRIENSRPVQKVSELQISPLHSPQEYGSASFSFELSSYYDRSGARGEELGVAMKNPSGFHNPFYPLIRDVLPNEGDLVDVERSRLIGMGSSQIYLKDQNGHLVNLSMNDEVWLGRLQEIRLQDGTARFVLNKGGIMEEVILEVEK